MIKGMHSPTDYQTFNKWIADNVWLAAMNESVIVFDAPQPPQALFYKDELTYFTGTESAMVRVPHLALILWHSIVGTPFVALALLKFFDPLLCFLELKITYNRNVQNYIYNHFSVLLKFIQYFVFEFGNGSWKIKISKKYKNIYTQKETIICQK